MNERTNFERRLAALIEAYGDRAPVDVDPTAMARFVATAHRLRPMSLWPRHTNAGVAWLVAAMALIASMIGGIIAGSGMAPPILSDRSSPAITPGPTSRLVYAPPSPQPSIPTAPIGFVGLPPDGAVASRPETGELVLGWAARPKWLKERVPSLTGLGQPQVRFHLFADGRLLWQVIEGTLPYSASAHTTGILERRLTPEGVELLRSEAFARGPFDDRAGWVFSGFIWSNLQVRGEDGFVDQQGLPGGWVARLRLASILFDPEAWLPASAWLDSKLRAFVPSSYGVCLRSANGTEFVAPADVLDALPPQAHEILVAFGSGPLDPPAEGSEDCIALSTEDARSFAAALEAAGFEPDRSVFLDYAIETRTGPGTISFDAILSDGTLNCTGCG